MVKDVWLPKGHKLSDDSKIQALLFSDNDWQIFTTDGASNILLICLDLARKWCDAGLLASTMLDELTFGALSFNTLSSHKKFALMPVTSGKTPDSKTDAVAFSLAMKESRKLAADVSFHDAIYTEQYSRLLPTYTITPSADDAFVLGTWLSGGVEISTDSFRRLRSLTGYISPDDLEKVITVAGLKLPTDVTLFKRKIGTLSKPAKKACVTNPADLPRKSQKQVTTDTTKVFTLPGRPQLELFFNEHIIDIIFHAEKYRALGIEFPSAIILHGPPGCGKTFAVERIIEFIDWPSYSISSNTIGSPYIHHTSKKISEIFNQAIENAPSIIVIDEMESFLSDRGAGGQQHHIEEVAEFLRRIPEAINNNVLIIAMTNMIDTIDPAICRRGRFDHIIEVGMPTRVEVASLLASLLSRLPKADTLDMDRLLDALTGKPLSDAAFVIREASRLTAKAGKSQIDQDSIEIALESLPRDTKMERRIGFAGNR
ncbi:MAG: ATP-binding protein [Desulfovibrio sp.]|jgi:adenylate kinase family enzyme|nr:ATP-binding protein [Desulfovibrio sp.]